MIELPEARVLADQLKEVYTGKTIVSAVANTSPHTFAWYTGDPALYNEKLSGKKITGSSAHGGRADLIAEDMRISFNDGVRMRSLSMSEKRPAKHQLLLEFDDGCALCCTVQMYGGMCAFPDGAEQGFYYNVANEKPSPLSNDFDNTYFDGLWDGVKKNLSAKAFLATEQRIPGLGNGVLQDILFNARINPRTKLQNIAQEQKEKLLHSIKETLFAMTAQGGRDVERDLFGCAGGYKTILSAKTLDKPCSVCNGELKREAYLGGNIYYCPVCQPLS